MTKSPYRIHFRQGEFELDVEGDRGFVESYVAAFLAGAPSPAEGLPENPGSKAKRARKTGPGAKAMEVDAEALGAFMKGRKAGSNKDRYLLYLGFLQSMGAASASDPMIRACFKAHGAKVPPNGRQSFLALRREGLVAPGPERGHWKLTPAGEAKIEGQEPAEAEASAKKSPKKKAAAKKPVAKKRAAKKLAAKKPVAKKPPVRKAAAKRTATKKPAAKPATKVVPVVPPKITRPKIAKVTPEPDEHAVEVLPDAMTD